MNRLRVQTPEFWISALGLTVLAGAFFQWCGRGVSLPGLISALVSAVLFMLFRMLLAVRYLPSLRLKCTMTDSTLSSVFLHIKVCYIYIKDRRN